MNINHRKSGASGMGLFVALLGFSSLTLAVSPQLYVSEALADNVVKVPDNVVGAEILFRTGMNGENPIFMEEIPSGASGTSVATPVFDSSLITLHVLVRGKLNFIDAPVINSSTGGLWNGGGLTFSINKSLPNGLILDTSTGGISGRTHDAGLFTGFTIEVNDGQGSSSTSNAFDFNIL